MPCISITLPAPPNRANPNSSNFWANYGAKKKYVKQCALELIVQKSKWPEWARKLPWRKIRWTGTVEVYNSMDDDNRTSLYKWPLDALRSCGVLLNDSRKECEMSAVPQEVVIHKKGRTLTMQVEVIENAYGAMS